MLDNTLRLQSLNEVHHYTELVKMQILLPPCMHVHIGLRYREISMSQFKLERFSDLLSPGSKQCSEILPENT